MGGQRSKHAAKHGQPGTGGNSGPLGCLPTRPAWACVVGNGGRDHWRSLRCRLEGLHPDFLRKKEGLTVSFGEERKLTFLEPKHALFSKS